MHLITISEKKTMNVESREGYVGGFGWRIEKEEIL